MDNQHRLISGYKELAQEDIDLVNEIKAAGETFKKLIERMRQREDMNNRWTSIAETQLQQGTMALVKAATNPDTW